MNKMVYRLMSVILAFAMTLGVYYSAGASSASVPLMSPITYYVSVTGNDANPGSQALPWKTIQKAANVAVAGDTVNIQPGTYNESITPKNSGVSGNPITFRRDGSTPVIVKGTDPWAVIIINQKNWTVWDGLTLIGSGNGVVIRDANNNTIKNCDISGFNIGVGIENKVSGLTASNNIISGNVIHDYGRGTGEGIYIFNRAPIGSNTSYVQGTRVENNTFFKVVEALQNTGGTLQADGTIAYLGTSITPANSVFRGNVIYNNTCDSGVADIIGNGHLIENNLIYNNLGSGSECTLYLAHGKNGIVRNNILMNNTGAASWRAAISASDWAGEISHNTIYSFNNLGISIANPPDSLLIKNNIIYAITNQQILRGGDTSKLSLDFNLFGKSESNLGTHALVADPKFIATSQTSSDFLRPQSGSPVCTAGEGGTYLGAFPCSGIVVANTTPSIPPTLASTPTGIPTYTPFSPTSVPSASATPTLLPTIPTAAASPVPVLPTATRISVPTATSIATLQPASPTPPPAIPTTAPATIKSLDIRVAKGINDVEESTGGKISTNSADLELVNSSGPQKVGIRFTGVGIPQGATIVKAYIQFKVGRATTTSTTLSIQGDARANAPAFATTARNVSSRPKTTGIVNWSPSYWSKLGAAGPAQSTPNLAPIIQEIVSRTDWASGNSMVIIITGSGKRIAKSYDGDTTGAPRLHIEYTTNTVVSNISAPLAMAVAVSTELPTALPTTAMPVSLPTATFQPPTPTIPVAFTPTVPPAPLLLPSLTPTSLALVLPTLTPTTESINTMSVVSVVNEQPVITSNGVLSIAENTAAVATVTATDTDLPAQPLTYSISGGADLALFNINSSTGELTFITAPDYEIPTDAGLDNTYNVTVQVSDGELAVTQDIAVSVTAINENNPVITSNGSLSIAENTTAVTTVTATDADLPAQTLTYSISGGTDSALFSINPSTGELTFITAPDFELPADTGSDNIYNATVQVSDGELSATQDIAVTVTALNDNNPVVTSNGVLSIAENTTAVATVTATDADQSAQTLTYSISGGPDSALFTINPSTGELTFVTAPDSELPTDAGNDNIYNVTVQASDGELTVTQDIAVSVTNVNENNPVITSNAALSIAENTAAVATVTATDIDLPAQALAYSISGGADLAFFSINPSTGELTFITAPDYEIPADADFDNTYNVTVQVSDGELAVTQDIAVSVTAVNENNPVITSNAALSIAENTTAVSTVTATDIDLPAQTLTYSISGGADSALFSINSSSGELTFITPPDFEVPTDAGSDNIYNVTVQASDGELAVTQDITVSVTSVNDNNPAITSNGILAIAENTTAVSTVTATDADLPAQPLTYSISGSPDSAFFSINSSTGELTFVTAPDYEAPVDAGNDNIYNVTVQASDGELTVTQDIAVTLTAVNENNPVITSNGSLSIAENTTAVTTVTASDADQPAQTLTYSIAGGADSALFSINSSTGELTFITATDFEVPADAGNDNVYNVTVQASDGELTATQDIATTVTGSGQLP